MRLLPTRSLRGAARPADGPPPHADGPVNSDGGAMAAAAPLSRRSVLRSSGAVVLGGGALAVVGVTSAACTVGSPAPEPDPLEPLADQAGADAAQAERLAAADPGRAAPLGVIAAERRAHAAALKTEIHRAAGTTPDADDAGAATTAPTADTSPTAPPPPTLDGLRAQLADSRRSAADAARDLAGYRAGLAGSVAAACAAELKVLIP